MTDPVPSPGAAVAHGRAPRLSVVLATDRHETIRPVLKSLRRQTALDALEVVVVAPPEGHRDRDPRALEGLAPVQLVETAAPISLPVARAEGVRAARAPLVFIGETHTYPEPGFAEALLRAFEGPWSAVVPAILNANPSGVPSWAAYLSDYGPWGEGRPAGEIADPLVYNTAYRRDALLELGDRLEHALDPYAEELWARLHASGHRARFEPAARLLHVNVGRPRSYVAERLLAGLLVGTRRARRWPWWRRALYVLGAPLIPVVLVRRLMEPVRRARALRPLPPGLVPAIAAGSVVRAAGEALGYAGLAPSSANARMTEIELHKVAHAVRRGA